MSVLSDPHSSPDSHITNIPLGLWFSLCTLTSVGYGELIPHTWLGRIFASLCAVIGVIVISLTIPVISANFTTLFAHVRSRDRAMGRVRRNIAPSIHPAGMPAPPTTAGPKPRSVRPIDSFGVEKNASGGLNMSQSTSGVSHTIRHQRPKGVEPDQTVVSRRATRNPYDYNIDVVSSESLVSEIELEQQFPKKHHREWLAENHHARRSTIPEATDSINTDSSSADSVSDPKSQTRSSFSHRTGQLVQQLKTGRLSIPEAETPVNLQHDLTDLIDIDAKKESGTDLHKSDEQ